MKKTIKEHEQKNAKGKAEPIQDGAIPAHSHGQGAAEELEGFDQHGNKSARKRLENGMCLYKK